MFQHRPNASFAAEGQPPEHRTPNEHRARAECERLQYVRSAADPPIDQHLHAPGTPIVRERSLPGAFAALHALGATEAALLAPDAPDLPPLLLGKLFRALGHAPAATCQAAGGGLVALAARLPLPSWLADALTGTDLDAPDALAVLRAAAPRPGQIPQGPSWHRLRTPGDVALLDPGLEGWESTRALLEGHPVR